MAKIQTFELDRWSEPDENHRVKHIGMADAKETFDKLKTHLEAHGLLPDEYFSFSGKYEGLTGELPEFEEALCIPNFGVLVVGCVYITVLRLANLTNCLTYTSSLTTAVCRFVYNISAADSLTLLPMIVFIGSPDRCGIMSILRNGLSVCDFLITIAAISIAGIAFCVAGGFLLSH